MSSSFTRFSPECLRAPVLESARRDSTTAPAFQVPGRSIYFILSSILWIRLHNVRGAVSSFTSILSLLLRLPLAFFFLFFCIGQLSLFSLAICSCSRLMVINTSLTSLFWFLFMPNLYGEDETIKILHRQPLQRHHNIITLH